MSTDIAYQDILDVISQLKTERETQGSMAIVDVLKRASQLMTEQNIPGNDGSLTRPEIMDVTGMTEGRLAKEIKTCIRSGDVEWTKTRRKYYGVWQPVIAYRVPAKAENSG